MSSYIMLADYTDQGIRDIKESPRRADAARELASACGAEMKELYLTMGGHDFVVMVEAPNDEAVAKFVLKIASLGNIRTTTLKAFTEQEYRNIIETLP